MFEGSDKAGAIASVTVTLNAAFDGLPAASCVEQCTVVVPIGNRLPLNGEQVTFSDSVTASVAVVENDTARPDDEEASVAMSAGTCSAGAVVSCTVTLNETLAWLPARS